MSTMAETPETLTVRDAAKRYGVSASTIRNWISRGLITKYRKPLDLNDYVSVREIDALKNAPPTPRSDD